MNSPKDDRPRHPYAKNLKVDITGLETNVKFQQYPGQVHVFAAPVVGDRCVRMVVDTQDEDEIPAARLTLDIKKEQLAKTVLYEMDNEERETIREYLNELDDIACDDCGETPTMEGYDICGDCFTEEVEDDDQEDNT